MPITMIAAKTRFPLGQVVSTPGAMEILTPDDIARLISRHAQGDWGDVPPEDAQENEFALEVGNRILSAYTVGEQKVWLITEADRSVTTILLPSEY